MRRIKIHCKKSLNDFYKKTIFSLATVIALGQNIYAAGADDRSR